MLETGELAYELTGFYKSSGIKLYEDSNFIYALARYNEVTTLSEENPFESLIYLNYTWWKNSKNRGGEWSNPEEKWLPYMLEYGWIKEVKTVSYE